MDSHGCKNKPFDCLAVQCIRHRGMHPGLLEVDICVEKPDRPSPFGSRFMARAVPVTPNATGRMVTPFSMRMAPSLVPVAVGAKFTVMVQVPFTAIGDEDTHVSVAE